MKDYILASLVAIIASSFCIHLLRPLAVRIGFVDRPSERKLHENEIPLIGGVSLFFGFCFAMLSLHVSLMPYRSLFAGSALLVLIGVVDDFRDLSAKLRLVGQLMVALMLSAWGGLLLNSLGNLFTVGNLTLGLWALPVTLLFVIGYINAFNMIDGQDGLAGSVALVQAFWLLMFALQLALGAIAHILAIFMFLIVVFLSFNMPLPWRKKADIFLGDSGSTFLAFVLIWVAVMLSQQNLLVVKPIAILWVMALPLLDLLQVISYRLKQKKSIFQPDRDHVHHVLHAYGVRKPQAALLLAGLQAVLGGIGFTLNYLQVSEAVSFCGFIVLGVMYFIGVSLLRAPKPKQVEENLQTS